MWWIIPLAAGAYYLWTKIEEKTFLDDLGLEDSKPVVPGVPSITREQQTAAFKAPTSKMDAFARLGGKEAFKRTSERTSYTAPTPSQTVLFEDVETKRHIDSIARDLANDLATNGVNYNLDRLRDFQTSVAKLSNPYHLDKFGVVVFNAFFPSGRYEPGTRGALMHFLGGNAPLAFLYENGVPKGTVRTIEPFYPREAGVITGIQFGISLDDAIQSSSRPAPAPGARANDEAMLSRGRIAQLPDRVTRALNSVNLYLDPALKLRDYGGGHHGFAIQASTWDEWAKEALKLTTLS